MASGNGNKQRPAQHQNHQPGRRREMIPQPRDRAEDYRGSGKLTDKIVLVTGGDSGIGRAAAIASAKEGADIAFVYLDETEDARETEALIKAAGRRCKRLSGDLGQREAAFRVVADVVSAFGRIDVLINNAAEQHIAQELTDISEQQLRATFDSNILSMFFLTQAALPHMRRGAAIVNTTSVTAFHGNPKLIDYSSTKGAIVSFTRSLAKSLLKAGIRVNAVAPGPVWTPLIPASFDAEYVAKFGADNLMGRAADADEIAPCYVFLASADASFMTGQVLHPNGGSYMA